MIHVVGYGIVDSLGNNPSDCFKKMMDTQNYPKESAEAIMPPMNPKNKEYFTPVQKLKFHAVHQALTMSELKHSFNVPVILSSVTNDMEISHEIYARAKAGEKISPKKMINRIYDIACSHVGTHYRFMGPSTAFFTSCSTSLMSIDYAMYLAEKYDYVIVGSGDHCTIDVNKKYYESMNALGKISMPFDDNRTGFVLGDGAGVLILQSEEKRKEYNSKSYAQLYPVHSSTDAFMVHRPRPDGLGQKIAMQKAIGNLEIDAVCAHATSTPVGDEIEYKAITEILPNTPIWAPKSKIGHLLGTSGIVELIYCIEAMKNKVIPHIQNLEKCSEDINKTLAYKDIEINKNKIRMLKNSFGFGGKNTSVVIEYNHS